MTLAFDTINRQYRLALKGALSHTAILGSDVLGNITRIDNVLDGMEKKIEDAQESYKNLQRQLENAKTDLEKPFDREEELAEKTKRLNQLNILLNMNEKDSTVIDTEPEQQSTPERNTQERER